MVEYAGLQEIAVEFLQYIAERYYNNEIKLNCLEELSSFKIKFLSENMIKNQDNEADKGKIDELILKYPIYGNYFIKEKISTT